MMSLAVIVLFLGIAGLLKKAEGAWLYLVSWLPMMIGMFTFNLTVVGAIEGSFWTIHAAEIGVSIESIWLSFALVYRLRRIEASAASKVQKSYQQLKEALSLVEQSNDSKEAFLLSAGHQLKSPMHVLMGNLQLLSEADEDLKHKDLIDQSDRSATELLFKIDNLLTYSQAVSSDLRSLNYKINLRSEFERIQHNWKHIFESSKVQIDLSFDESIPEVLYLEWIHIRKIIRIAIEYAFERMSEGFITVSFKLISNRGKSVSLYCEVIDNGPSVGDDTLSWFSPDQSEVTWNGQSMGLLLCKKLVDHIQGVAKLENLAVNGLKFSLTCPVQVLNESQELSDISLAGVRVLVVDDMEINLQLMASFVRKLKAEAVLARSGEGAIEVLKSTSVDLVLMDCLMPGLSGLEATFLIRSDDSIPMGLPIIAVSANDSDVDRENCINSGMNDFLAKPVRIDALEYKLKEWLNIYYSKKSSQIRSSNPLADVEEDDH